MARRRFELTDAQHERIEDLLPSESEGRGRPMHDHRPIVNGIFWILRTGAPWRDLPERYGKWKTVYDRFRRWSEDGTLERIVERLQAELDLEEAIDWSQFNIDSTSVRASRAAAGGPEDDKKGSAPNMKTRGTARRSATAGQRHEAAFFEPVMDAVRVPRPVGRPRKRPEALASGKAYDAAWIRRWCRRRDIESVIPARNSTRSGPGRPPTCDEAKYARRNVVERCVGRLKEHRRIATRYEKKASHYKAMLQWAFIGQYLRYGLSDSA